ncbi:MAG: hypothetical protein R3E14_02945 [Erythrobacter sp.]
MNPRFRLPLIALALLLPMPVVAQQAAQDFSLPAAPAPTASPRVQGPVDEESGVVPVRPQVIRTATPAPTPVATATPTPNPTPAATGAQPPRTTTASPATQPTPRRQPVEQIQRPAPIVESPLPAREFPSAGQEADDQPVATPLPSPTPAQPIPPAAVTGGAEESFDWTLLALIAGALALMAGGFAFWRRRHANVAPPEIERPVVSATPARKVVPATEALTIRCEAEKLTRSAVYATLKYRLTLVNRTDAALNDVAIGVDLVSAHAGAPMEEQVATTATTLETRHTLTRIAPRQNVSVEGQVQLPLAGAQVIFQGRHPLLVPLMRVRVDGAGEGALVKTFVVGQGMPDGGRVQPFPLDEAPRSYAPIAHRELA